MGKTKDIKNKISDLIAEVTGTNQNIRKLYRYFEPTPSEFPCVMVYLKSIDEERLDFQDNQVNAEYQIKLCLPLQKTANQETTEDLRMDCIDDILVRLRKKDAVETLDGLTFKADIVSGEPYLELDSSIPMLITDLTLATSRTEFIAE